MVEKYLKQLHAIFNDRKVTSTSAYFLGQRFAIEVSDEVAEILADFISGIQSVTRK